MTKKEYRYSGGFLNRQQTYLNAMDSRGVRLVRTGRLPPTPEIITKNY